MKTFMLAARNLLRNRRRSLTTVLAVVVGTQSILLFGGYSRNITYGLQTDFIRSGGHLQLQRQGYFLYGSGDPTSYGILNYDKVIDEIKKDSVLAPMVTVVTPTLLVGGIAGNFTAGVSRTVLAGGSVIDDQNRLRVWDEYGFPPPAQPLALTGTPADTAFVGTGVARVLQLCGVLDVPDCPRTQEAPPAASGRRVPADIAALAAEEAPRSAPPRRAAIELLAATARGAPNVTTLNVVKAESTGIKEFDDVFIALHLTQAQRLVYGRDPPRATSIVVQLKHTDQIPAAKKRLTELLPRLSLEKPLEVFDFQTLNPFYGQVIAMFGAIFGFIAILMGTVVLFTIANTMSMAVVERTTEIGTLRAMGLRRGGVRRLFICEGLILGTAGAVLGAILAISIAALINYSGLTWTPPGRSPVPLLIRVAGEPWMVINTVIGLILVAVASAWWPARRAARSNIVEALRHV